MIRTTPSQSIIRNAPTFNQLQWDAYTPSAGDGRGSDELLATRKQDVVAMHSLCLNPISFAQIDPCPTRELAFWAVWHDQQPFLLLHRSSSCKFVNHAVASSTPL